MKKVLIILIIFIIAEDFVSAQRFQSRRWKRMRYEVYMGLGGTNFLGELGGADRIGTNMLRDFEISMTRPSLSLGMRYKVYQVLAVKTAFVYGWLRGDDRTTNEPSREYRNLHFYSPIVEWATQLEYSVIREKIGHRYNLRTVKGIKAINTNTYFFIGIGGFYFNPKGKYNGKWYALQPLCTEGQGLVPTRKKYSRFQVAIPFGIGFKYGLDRRWSIGLEYGMRKTFTDYIDDVSTTYFHNETILDEYGVEAAYFADPSDGTMPYKTGVNQQRGDARNKDSYMFMIINLTYKLKTTRKGLPKF